MPLYTKESLETLRQKIDLIEILKGYLDLKRTGGTYKAHCPFHEEKTPSFVIQKGETHYHCFGCGAHGDAIQFLMNYLNLSFTETVEMLAERFHVPLEKNEITEEKGPNKSVLREALEKASHFFQCMLLHSEEGHEALAYLYRRGLFLNFIMRFGVGYAPKSTGQMHDVMNALHISDAILQEAGLLGEHQREFFRERITFPIHHSSGGIIGFSARKFKEETFGGKYINTPETPLFKKSKVLFGLNYCRRMIAKERRAILVEGQIDCLKLIEAGLPYTVASLGTAFGESHVKELQNLGVHEVILMFDNDQAGEAATLKVGNLFQKSGIEVTVVLLPSGKDPDSFLSEEGVDSLMEHMQKGKNYLNYAIEILSRKFNPQSPAGKKELIETLKVQIKEWNHPVMVHESLKKLAELTQVPEKMVGVGSVPPPMTREKKIPTSINPNRILELDFLRWLLLMGEEKTEFVDISKNLSPDHFWNPICRTLFEVYHQTVSQKESCDLLALFSKMNDPEAGACMDEILQKKINRERAEVLFLETTQKLLDRQWMQQRELIKIKIHTGNHTEEEVLALAKEFDALKKIRPVISGWIHKMDISQ